MIPDLASRRERLAAFLDDVALRPLVWGVDDCITGYVARWIEQERGVDPAFGLRGRWSGQMSCMLLVHRHGGMTAFMGAALAKLGIEPTDNPVVGDVGAVQALTDDGLVFMAAICAGGDQWAVRMTGGILLLPVRAALAWGL